jgi:hypothetical protein
MPHQPERANDDEREVITAIVVHQPSKAVQLALYEETFVEPVRRLNETLSDVLDPDAHPDRTPEAALALVKGAVERFAEDADGWLSPSTGTP